MVNLDNVYVDYDSGIHLFTAIECRKDNLIDVMEFISPSTLNFHTLTQDDIKDGLGSKKDIGKNGIVFEHDGWFEFVPFGGYIGKSFVEFDGSTSINKECIIWEIEDLSEYLTVQMFIDNLVELINSSF